MSEADLRACWTNALAAASAAVEAVRRAHVLSPDECRAESSRIASERNWLEHVLLL